MKVILLVVWGALMPEICQAYIDPGTASAFLGFLSAAIAGASAILIVFYRRILAVLKAAWRGLGRLTRSITEGGFLPSRRLFIGSAIAAVIAAIGLYIASLKKQIKKGIALMQSTSEKLIVLGMDGLDHSIVTALMEKGALPNFKKLAEKGSFMPLEPAMPPQSPVAWSSMATGQNPGEHGIFDFITRRLPGTVPALSILKRRKIPVPGKEYEPVIGAPAFWDRLTQADIANTVIRWPLTFPPSQIKGSMLGGLGVPEINGLLNQYYYYTEAEPAEGITGRVIRVQREKDVIRTHVAGPLKKGAFKTSQLTRDISVRLQEAGALLELDGAAYSLKAGHWSEWLRTRFKVGLMKEASVIFKVYLESIDPVFTLYMTALQLDPVEPAFTYSFPEAYSGELAAAIGTYATLGMPEDTKALDDGVFSDEVFLQQADQIHAERLKMFWHEFRRFKKGMLAFVFDTSDRVQHMFWRHNEMDANFHVVSLSAAIEREYRKMDQLLGEVLGKIEPDTRLVACSDHGFTSFNTTVDLNRWLVENGFMVLKGLPDRENWGALYQQVDWSRTRLYAAGFTSVYINQKGREKQGLVTADQIEALSAEFIKKLSSLRDDQKNPVVEQVYRGSDLYSGKHMDAAPDFVVGFRPGFRMSWQTAIGGVFEKVLAPNDKKWSGDHLVDARFVPGIFLSNFKIDRTRLHGQDIGRIILKNFNLEP